MNGASRLPGIYFNIQSVRLDEVLPRMDIAAFVGFTRSGPLHTPVPVESVNQFRDIFGADVVLHAQAGIGAVTRSYLGASVEEFFANGGLRCWIVRVANGADTHQFTISNLQVLHGIDDNLELAPVYALARSAGSWALQWQVKAVKRLQTINFSAFELDADGQGWSLSVQTAKAGLLDVGELLRFNLQDGPSWFGFVDRLETDNGVLRLNGTYGLTTELTSPQGLVRIDLEMLNSSPATPLLNVQRVRCDLLANRNDGQSARVDDLALNSRHPRFWGRLPTDHTLFSHPQGELNQPPSAELQHIRSQAQHPRFPLAGLEDFQHQGEHAETELFYLPILSDLSSEQDMPVLPPDRAERSVVSDGLEQLEAALFLNGSDTGLNGLRLDSLAAELEHEYYIRQQTLKGVYSLLPIQEVSLLSVPDLVHLQPAEIPYRVDYRLADAPLLTLKHFTDEACLSWQAEDGIYVLEQSPDDSFNHASMVYQGAKREFCFAANLVCKQPEYYRVALVDDNDVAGLWSNTVVRQPLFNNICVVLPALEIHLAVVQELPAVPGQFELEWALHTSDEIPEFSYLLQESEQTDFSVILNEQKLASNVTSYILEPSDETIRYYRICAVVSSEVLLWSNTVQIISTRADNNKQASVSAEAEMPNASIIAVQRTMLRFCASRQDLMAVLSFPDYNPEQALQHIDALMSSQQGDDVVAGVLALSAGESRAFDYAAIFHPWMAVSRRSDDTNDVGSSLNPFVPCDGAICGSMARMALRSGAWIAPANMPLQDVVALRPEIDRFMWQQLASVHINLLCQDGRGFMLMNADTLSLSEENRPLNVRRLMILLRRLVLREGNRNVFEPDSIGFRNRVYRYFNHLLTGLYSRGAFAGRTQDAAFRVVVDSSVNIQQSIDRGRFIVELRVAPSRPMEFITVRLLQAGNADTVFVEGGS